ncbi:sigma-70 family RNA polymerase sigma factor [Luteibaculum oceani]|uniref:Sigma-70 family RNA polymerase sigma factor n=1 Tax=Luteibaculum oceani TaxID=1294296 RepID=A0A5C6VBS7_9FLAO|nr:sigma-70 family RNA polymerase sigma factor [Luteibaculum oceani]
MLKKDVTFFNYLYDNYSATINGVIYRIVNDVELAEDLTQEVFVKIWDKISYYDPSKGRIYTWMLNLARNKAIDQLRSKGHKKNRKTDFLENFVNPSDNSLTETLEIDHIGIEAILKKLPKELLQLIDLMYFQGYTQAEIAEELEMPLGTVKTRLRKAILELRKQIVEKN